MALISVPRIITSDVLRAGFIFSRMSKLVRIPSASMTSKENRDPDVKKIAPWPYKTKPYPLWKSLYEGTSKRFDENTKFVVVEGNIGAGKSSFAKQLAEAFDFEYFPEPSMERWYITSYGYDLREIDELMPPSYKCCDLKTFYANPYHPNVPKFQFRMYMFRVEQYVDALAHILNTGQGVVLERCAFSDFVFTDTMAKFGWISPRAMNLYKDITKNTLEEFLRPHLIIYLDISPEVALERIKKRNDPVEVNSKVLTKEYLTSIDQLYKQKYLKAMQKHAEILVYDWSHYGDIEVVVEDIERINFDKYTVYDKKLKDWRKSYDWEWNTLRSLYTDEKFKVMDFGNIVRPSVEELYHPGEEVEEYDELISKIPGEKFINGFNVEAGDKVFFKRKADSYWKTELYRM